MARILQERYLADTFSYSYTMASPNLFVIQKPQVMCLIPNLRFLN